MKKITRRQFIKSAALSAGAIALDQLLAACGGAETPASPAPEQALASVQPNLPPAQTPPPEPQSQPTSTVQEAPAGAPVEAEAATPPPEAARSQPTATPPGSPDLVVARAGEPGQLVRRSLAAIGGMEQFVPKGASVIIKPNICVAYHTYEYAATTNPWVVAELVKMCLEVGAKSVKVMDAPFGGTAKEAYAISGIEEQVKAAGAEMVFMPGFKYVATEIPKGKDLHKSDIFGDILQTDVLINVPIAKTHSLAGLTLGMKNLMGIIMDRQGMHRKLGQRLADLATRVYPTLTVIDAVRVLVKNGPTGGNLDDVKKMDTLIVSRDMIAADSFATTLFGLQPDAIASTVAGSQMGLGKMNLQDLKVEEILVGA